MPREHKRQLNLEVPALTWQQVDALRAATGMTLIQLAVLAFDRLARDFNITPRQEPPQPD